MAFLISDMEVKIRISAKAADAAQRELIAPVEERIRDTLGEAVFGTDDDTVERIVIELSRPRDGRSPPGRGDPGPGGRTDRHGR